MKYQFTFRRVGTSIVLQLSMLLMIAINICAFSQTNIAKLILGVSVGFLPYSEAHTTKKVTEKWCQVQIKWYQGDSLRIIKSLMYATPGLTEKHAKKMYEASGQYLDISCKAAVSSGMSRRNFRKSFQKSAVEIWARLSISPDE